MPTTVPPILQDALKDGFTEAVVACDLPEPGKLPSLDSCQKRFRWTGKKADLALHSDVGLVLQEGDAEKFPQALGFESLDPFFRVSKQGPSFTASRRNLYSLNLLAMLMALHHQILFRLAIAEAILMSTSAEQVPSLHRVAPRYLKLVTSSNF